MITVQLLKLFCSQPWQERTTIENPFSDGEFTYATDGRILLRVPRLADVPENSEAPSGKGIQVVLSAYPNGEAEWISLPKAPEKPKAPECASCYGTGRTQCRHCASDIECDECGGKGKIEKLEAVQIGVRKINGDYLRLMEALPNLKAAINHGEEKTALAFKFDGGIGLVMPLNPSVPL